MLTPKVAEIGRYADPIDPPHRIPFTAAQQRASLLEQRMKDNIGQAPRVRFDNRHHVFAA